MTWKASVKLDDDDEGEMPYALSIGEVGSARQYDYLRQQTYAGASAFVLCFDVGDYRDETMKEVRERWAGECRSHGGHIPIILVGTKIDQRQGTLRAFTPEQVSCPDEIYFFILTPGKRDELSPPRFVRRRISNARL
jgi:hypothetical protein